MGKLRALRYFLRVAESSSFTSAAQSLSVPASSVSRRIRGLEIELRIDLFHRSKRVVELTVLGELYYGCSQTDATQSQNGLGVIRIMQRDTAIQQVLLNGFPDNVAVLRDVGLR
jgi:DNA-binding transcriptional LysR family regulator